MEAPQIPAVGTACVIKALDIAPVSHPAHTDTGLAKTARTAIHCISLRIVLYLAPLLHPIPTLPVTRKERALKGNVRATLYRPRTRFAVMCVS